MRRSNNKVFILMGFTVTFMLISTFIFLKNSKPTTTKTPIKQTQTYVPPFLFKDLIMGKNDAIPPYESIKIVKNRVDSHTFPPPPPANSTKHKISKMTDFIESTDDLFTECNTNNPNVPQAVKDIYGDDDAYPWVNYVIIRPQYNYLHQFLSRFLFYVDQDRIISNECKIRVYIVANDAKHRILKYIQEQWTMVSGIQINSIEQKKGNDMELLATATKKIAEAHPRDIIYIADTQVIIPPGFTQLIRSSLFRGENIFMPSYYEFTKPSKEDFNIDNATLMTASMDSMLNVGIYAQDVSKLGVYSSKKHLPMPGAHNKGYYVTVGSVSGLLKPLCRLVTNEVRAFREVVADEKILNDKELANRVLF